MATIWPDVPPDSISPTAEAMVYRALEQRLPDRADAFHSVSLNVLTDRGARDGEIDFIVVDPERGLLVLEVKGGKEITFDPEHGTWCSIDHGGSRHKIRDPFEQASRNLYMLRTSVQRRGLYRSGELPFPYGYACVFPDTVVPENRPLPLGTPEALCLDGRALEDFDTALGAAHSHWSGKKGGIEDGTWAGPLVDRVLAPGFETESSLQVQIQREKERFLELTEQQASIYNQVLRANRRALVRGYAGTGKTVLAQRRAAELAEAGHETLFLCFNRLLADQLGQELSEVSGLTVATFHEMADLLAGTVDALTFPDEPVQQFWDEGAADLLLDAVGATATRYDAIVVDEAQDFRETWWLPIRQMLADDGYFYVFYDPEQNVYDTNLEPLDEISVRVPLVKNCRTTRAISQFLRELADLDELEDADHVAEGEAVETFAYERREEQISILERILRNLKQDVGLSSSEIMLLSPFRREKSVLGDRLAGYHIEPYRLEDPSEDTLYHSTVLGFKGLDATAVVLFDVAADHVASREPHVYVGCSRAENLLFVLHEEPRGFLYNKT